jgi:hypothetical protein
MVRFEEWTGTVRFEEIGPGVVRFDQEKGVGGRDGEVRTCR